MDKRQVMGKRLNRLDGVAKASGKAKYSSDMNPDGILFAMLLTSPHAHCTIKSIDTTEAKKVPGVTAIRVINGAGKELSWRGAEIASVAAISEPAALDAVRKIKVEYEIMPHLVKEADLSKVGPRARPSGEQVTGDPEKGFSDSAAVIEGYYGVPVITHCCLESTTGHPHRTFQRWAEISPRH
jgi:xanthine dehydrogenase YagR molybdenum-binding subunit